MTHLALAFALAVVSPPMTPQSQSPAPGHQAQHERPQAEAQSAPAYLLPIGPPKLVDIEIRDGGFNNIDRGVMVAFTPQGRRYEVWEVQKNVAMDHALVLAHDEAGRELWRTEFRWQPGEAWSNPLAATVDEAGDFYFMYITPGAGSSYKWRVVKVTQAGAIAWQKTLYTTSWGRERTFMAAHPQGGIVVLSAAHGQVRDLYTARISSAGDVTWESKYDVGGENQFPGALVVAPDGSVYVVGDDDLGMHVRKYSASGIVRWTHDFPGRTVYEKPVGRHAFLDRAGDLVVAGSARSGSGPHRFFVQKYAPQGDVLLSFTRDVAQGVTLTDRGLQGVYATHDADGAVYLAWDASDQLDSAWTLTKVHVPVRPPGSDDAVATGKKLKKATPPLQMAARVQWTKTFDGEAAMSVERLIWFPNGAVGVFGRGKRMLAGHDYRADTRLRAVTPTGVDLGMVKFSSGGDFNNEPVAVALGLAATAHVLGWQYWSGDGWNDENVMRLRFQLRP